MPTNKSRQYDVAYRATKRALDVVGSLTGIAIILPVFPLFALLIRLDSPGPIFFRQPRVGRGGRLFSIYKFRTMAHGARELLNADGSRFVGNNDPRITRVGKILRTLSLDELPQLINILKGEMSLVGPRPDQPPVAGVSQEILRKKQSVKPGLTSLASVNGRNAIPWRERLDWELRYVDNASLSLDLQILFKTVLVVVRRDGVYCPADTSNECG